MMVSPGFPKYLTDRERRNQYAQFRDQLVIITTHRRLVAGPRVANPKARLSKLVSAKRRRRVMRKTPNGWLPF